VEIGPVNWSLALVAAFFSLVGCTVQIFGGLFQLAPFVILRDSLLSKVFTLEQLQAAVLLSFTLYSQTYTIGLVLFACYDLLLGYLIYRSTFVPRILGAVLMCAGVAGLTFLWQPLATALLIYIELIGGLGEGLLMLWLLVKGVNISRWQEKAGAALV
jgi:hypothetical protein